jgi:HK97 family phage prohead protease
MEIEYGSPIAVEEVKSVGDAWEVSGYASTFGNVDLGGDVVVKGAFDEWLDGWKSGQSQFKTRFLFSHQSSMILGKPISMSVDDKGLLVRAKISKTQLGSDVHTLLKDGALDSFSIGYIPAGVKMTDDGLRMLTKIDLPEFSLVAMPMNPLAEVNGVKQSVKGHVHCALCQVLINDADEDAKAQWTAAFINNLPDSAFAYIEPGGSKDEDGKTVPRSKRHFPHHGTGGGVDLPHLRNALARAPQSPFGDKALPHLRRHARAEGVGDAGKDHEHDAEFSYEDMTLAQLASATNDVVAAFGERVRDLFDKLQAGDFSLTEAKRTDLQALLETFSGIDAVRHDAEAVLAHKQEQLPDPKLGQISVTALALELCRHRLRARGVEV